MMTIFDVSQEERKLTSRQRWSQYFLILFSISGFVIGVNLRDGILNAVTLYTNTQAGIRAEYPQNWLIDNEGDYIFRVRDISQTGFKTTIQISSRAVSPDTTTRNVVDALALRRSQTLSSYTVFSIEPYTLPNEVSAFAVTYSFVTMESNPFLESVPIVVEGQDILTIKRGQALIITFLSDSRTYQQNYARFERFLSALEI